MTATALDKLRLLLFGIIGILILLSVGIFSSTSTGSPEGSGPNKNTSPG
jgi:hypothetical protein